MEMITKKNLKNFKTKSKIVSKQKKKYLKN